MRYRATPYEGTISMARTGWFQLDQVEGPHEDARVMVPIADAVEARDAIISARNCLAVDDAGARAQPSESLDDEREAVGPAEKHIL